MSATVRMIYPYEHEQAARDLEANVPDLNDQGGRGAVPVGGPRPATRRAASHLGSRQRPASGEAGGAACSGSITPSRFERTRPRPNLEFSLGG